MHEKKFSFRIDISISRSNSNRSVLNFFSKTVNKTWHIFTPEKKAMSLEYRSHTHTQNPYLKLGFGGFHTQTHTHETQYLSVAIFENFISKTKSFSLVLFKEK